ncbi:chromate transporter [Miniphocaeibacter halophilus]|uniref:Chromate transporter n=1 Tax=Miniphocaeibacter halophilus TaxID=2931922 RepID=A0AC61MSD5_9FIRM|nr:chromate transporter [Miniphocaeibacter halophilus]QQK08585.1 chromate transporter [Miniphocaeibacter halophilus]
MKKNLKLYLWLLYVNLFISSFTFGGGYVVVPMIKKYFVEDKNLISEDELMEMAAIAQSSPGSIAVNLSILAGKKVAGVPGIIITLISCIIPPVIILGLISKWYVAFSNNIYINAALKGMQACVIALIIDLVIDMYKSIIKENSRLLKILAPLSFVASAFFNINVILVLVSSCLVSFFTLFFKMKKGVKVNDF